MRIVEINSVCGNGSTGRIVENIASFLNRNDDEAVVVYGRGDTDYKCAYKISNRFDNYLHGIITRLFDAHGRGSIAATYGLLKYLDKYKPDIIHLHLLHGYYINYNILFNYIKKHDIPILWTMHDCWAITGHCPHFVTVGCKKWQRECSKCPLKHEYPQSILWDRSKKNYIAKKRAFSGVKNMTIVTPSRWLKEIIEESFLGNYPTIVINNGIDIQKFKPAINPGFKKEYGLEDKKILLSVANGFGEQKGLLEYIKLSELLEKKYKIVLVGVNKKGKEICKNSNVMAIERVDSIESLLDIYSSADVFLNLTLADTFPTVNMEALACGLPIITYNTGGSPEIISEKTGYVVEQHDFDGVIEAIHLIDNNPINREECIKRASEFFSVDKFLHKYSELLKSINDRGKD